MLHPPRLACRAHGLGRISTPALAAAVAWLPLALAAAALSLALTNPAHAQSWSLHAQGGVATGWTDNVSNAADTPAEPDPGVQSPEGAVYLQLRPAVLFSFESPRTVHVTSLGADFNLYSAESQPTNWNSTLSHNSLFTTGPSTELGIGMGLNTGQVSAVLGEAGGELAQAAPSGESRVIGINGNQAFRWQLNRRWRLSQGVNLAQVETEVRTNDTQSSLNTSHTGGLSMGLDRAWARTALGLNATVSLLLTEQAPPEAAPGAEPEMATSTKQRTYNVSVNLRRDLDPRWAANAQVGVSAIDIYESVGQVAGGQQNDEIQVIPVGNLGVSYFRPVGTVTISVGGSVGHSIVPNLLLGVNTETTNAAVMGTVPLPFRLRDGDPTLRISTTLGYSYSRVPAAAEETNWSGYTGDLALTWLPVDAWAVSLRLQRTSTMVDAQYLNPATGLPLANAGVPTPFDRTSVVIQVGGRWPTRQAAVMPDRRELRVDRANETGGDEEQSVGGGREDNPGGGR